MFNYFRLQRSFRHAFHGFSEIVRREQNFRLHILATLLVIALGLYFQIKIWEWCLLILIIMIVLILEIVNTAIERLTDIVKPIWHETVRDVKDIMATAVLVSAIAGAIIGLLIFLPYFFT